MPESEASQRHRNNDCVSTTFQPEPEGKRPEKKIFPPVILFYTGLH